MKDFQQKNGGLSGTLALFMTIPVKAVLSPKNQRFFLTLCLLPRLHRYAQEHNSWSAVLCLPQLRRHRCLWPAWSLWSLNRSHQESSDVSRTCTAPTALCSQILRLYEVWHKTLKNINSLKMWWSRTCSCFCYRAELWCFTHWNQI